MNTQKKLYAAPEIHVAFTLTDNLLNSFSKTDSGDNTGGNVTPPEPGEFSKKHTFILWDTEEETPEQDAE